jgi:hypothetical protein
MPARHEFKVPENISELSPEEQEEWRQKELEYRQRLTREDLEDMIYKEKQMSKLQKELEEGKKTAPTRRPTEREQVEKERGMVEEFLSKERGEEKKREEGERKLKELMLDPSIMVQEPPGGYKCMNMIGDKPCDEPATKKLLHGGLLGDTPPITLCKDCSKLLKIVNIGFEDPETEKRLRKKQLEKELRSWEKAQEKARKKQKKEPSKVPGSQSVSMKRSGVEDVLKKIANLANKLDTRGLHDEANLLDKILKS